MTFDEAEARFRELQARVQRGEAISRAEYEDQVSQLAVQDDRGVLWEINPRTGKWMYFDGAEWVGGIPPGRDSSTVMPIPRGPASPAASGVRPAPPAAPPPSVTPPPARVSSPSPLRSAPMTPRTPAARGGNAPAPRGITTSPESIPPYRRVGPEGPMGGPPEGSGSGTPGPGPARVLREGPLGGPNREWVPLAIGAVVLLMCAVVLFVGGRFALSVLGPAAATPTRIASVPTPTNTPIPTVVRLPTQPPVPPSPVPVIAKVIERSVNIRQGPGTQNKVIGSLKKDNTISLIGRNADSTWYQVTIAGSANPGWVFGETLQITAGSPSALPVATGGPAPATKAPAPAGPAPAATPTVIGAQ